MYTARAHFEGNLFSGSQRDRAMREYTDAVERAGAERAEQLVSERLERVLRNPTGYYQSQIGVRRDGGDWRVDDNNVIYGPWLEGTGSRNRTTRFKGYATFRHVTQIMERQIQRIGERILPRFLSRFGG
jgi:hypothetical protein